MNELKRCPFCGGKAEILEWKNQIPQEVWFVGCNNEGCYLSRPRGIHGNKQNAIDLWNKRA